MVPSPTGDGFEVENKGWRKVLEHHRASNVTQSHDGACDAPPRLFRYVPSSFRQSRFERSPVFARATQPPAVAYSPAKSLPGTPAYCASLTLKIRIITSRLPGAHLLATTIDSLTAGRVAATPSPWLSWLLIGNRRSCLGRPAPYLPAYANAGLLGRLLRHS